MCTQTQIHNTYMYATKTLKTVGKNIMTEPKESQVQYISVAWMNKGKE